MTTPSSTRATLARNTVASWLSYAAAIVIALALTPLVIRSVGPVGYGVWILLSQLTGYAGLLDVGVQPAVARFVADARARGDEDDRRSIISTAIVLHGTIGLCVLAILAFVSLFVDRWFDLGGLPPAEIRAALVIVALSAAIGFPASVLAAILKGRLRFDLLSALTTATQVVRAAGILLSIGARAGIVGLALASLASSVFGLCGAAWLASRGPEGLSIDLRAVSRDALRRLMSVGGYAFVGQTGWYVAYATDAVLIGALLSVHDVASFGLAVNVLSILSGVAGAFAQTFMPLASAYHATGMGDSLRRSYLMGSRLSLAMVMPLALALLVEGPRLLSWWVGPEVGLPAGTLLRVLTLAHLPVIANGVASQMALGAGLQKRSALLSIGEGVSNLGLSFALARPMGVVGVAVGTLVPSWIFQGVVWPAWVGRGLGASLSRYWVEGLGPALIPVLPALATFALLERTLRPSGTMGVLALLALQAVVYVLGATYTCLSPQDRALAWASLRERVR